MELADWSAEVLMRKREGDSFLPNIWKSIIAPDLIERGIGLASSDLGLSTFIQVAAKSPEDAGVTSEAIISTDLARVGLSGIEVECVDVRRLPSQQAEVEASVAADGPANILHFPTPNN